MLEITATTFEALEDDAWSRTTQWLVQTMPDAAIEGGMRSHLDALPPDRRRSLINHAVASARRGAFEVRDDVLALALLLLRCGPTLELSVLDNPSFDASEKLAILKVQVADLDLPVVAPHNDRWWFGRGR